MDGPFSNASLRAALNRDREKIERNEISIADWDVSQVTDMSGLFEGWSDFNQPIGKLGHEQRRGHVQHVPEVHEL